LYHVSSAPIAIKRDDIIIPFIHASLYWRKKENLENKMNERAEEMSNAQYTNTAGCKYHCVMIPVAKGNSIRKKGVLFQKYASWTFIPAIKFNYLIYPKEKNLRK
jgi:hypothetical protein